MNKPNSERKVSKWKGVVTDLDRHYAATDPRQLKFAFDSATANEAPPPPQPVKRVGKSKAEAEAVA